MPLLRKEGLGVVDDGWACTVIIAAWSTTPSPSFPRRGERWRGNPRRGVARWRLSQIICSIIELAKLEYI